MNLTTLEDNIGSFDCGCNASADRSTPIADSMFAPIPGIDSPMSPRRCTCGLNPCRCGGRGGAVATANPVININIDSNKNNTARPQVSVPSTFDSPPQQKTYVDEFIKAQQEVERLRNRPPQTNIVEKRVKVPVKKYINMPIDRVRTATQQQAQVLPIDRVRTETKQNPINMVIDRVKNLFTQKAQVIPVDRVVRSAKATAQRPQQIFKTSM